jgi:hypothetical protein
MDNVAVIQNYICTKGIGSLQEICYNLAVIMIIILYAIMMMYYELLISDSIV